MLKIFSFFSSVKTVTQVLIFIFLVSCGSGNKSPSSPVTPTGQITVAMNSSIGGIANNATNTSTSPIIALTFSQPMNTFSLNANSIKIVSANGSGDSVTISNFVVNANNQTVLLTPSLPLAQNTLYHVTVNSNAVGANGNKTVNTVFSFTTGSQNSLQVAFINPGAATSSVSLLPIFTVMFNMPVTSKNAGAILLAQVSGVNNPVGLTLISSDESQMIYNFQPSNQLLADTEYTITFTPEIYSVVNTNSQLPNTSFNFTTGNVGIAPMVVFNNIFNNKTGLSTSPLVQVEFNEEINSLTSSNIVVVNTSNNNTLPISNISVSGSGNIYNVQLTGLNINANYQIYFAGVTSANSNIPLVNPLGDYFSTGNSNPSNPTVHLVYPANNSQNVASSVQSILIQFDQPVIGVNANSVNLYANNTSSPLASTIAPNIGVSNSYVITPAITLPTDATVIVALSNSIVSQSSNLPLVGASLKFTTIANTNMQNINAMTIAPNINGAKYMYIANYSANNSNLIQCQVTENSQNQPVLENCSSVAPPSPLTGWPGNISSLTYAKINNNNYLYVASNPTMMVCALDSNSGNVVSCSQISSAIIPDFVYNDTVINIDVSNMIGYVTSGIYVAACTVNVDGSFNTNSCSNAQITGQGIGWGSTIYNNQLYSIGQFAGMWWYSCSVTSGSVSCSTIPLVSSNTWYLELAIVPYINPSSPGGNIYLSDNWTYNNSSSSNGLFAFSNVNSLVALSNPDPNVFYTGTTPLTMIFDSVNGGTNNYIYISDYLSGHIFACAINSSSGQFSECNIM